MECALESLHVSAMGNAEYLSLLHSALAKRFRGTQFEIAKQVTAIAGSA
jgi:hypothetical protein